MPRDSLTREQLVRAAIDLLDADGIDGLSMRKLGGRLRVAATAMYWHVPTKDELVLLAADAVWHEIDLPVVDGTGWRAGVEAMAQGLLATILAHPWLVTAMATHLRYGPGKARHDEHLLGILEGGGFVGDDVDRVAAAVLACTLGFALGAVADAAWHDRPDRDGPDDGLAEPVDVLFADRPRLRARMAHLQESGAPAPTFDDCLAIVLDGVEARLRPPATAHSEWSPNTG